MTPQPRLWPWWLLWVVFVAYGSLVPLQYQPMSWDMAWQRLLSAPMLELGIESRADWVANGVLYFPIGFLTTALLMGSRPGGAAKATTAALSGVLFGIALAVAVEFAQVYFPPRTVSRNDLLAEIVGTCLGALAALAGFRRLQLLLAGFDTGGGTLAHRLAPAYALAYFALAMFPYDFLISGDEWSHKLASGMAAPWLVSHNDDGSTSFRAAKLIIEILLVGPLGAWWASRKFTKKEDLQWGKALIVGTLLGLVVETAQLAIASGVSQGASVLFRALGFTAGAAAWQVGRRWHVEEVRFWLRRASLPVLALYLPAMAIHHGWWRGPWLVPEQALQRLQHEVHFVPFYYHYFTTEMQALSSLTAVSLSFAPIALLGWAWHQSGMTVAISAVTLALLIEAGKLLPSGSHPDPTNVLIAGVSSWCMHWLLLRLSSRRRMSDAVP
jgi:VanZ family protein